MVVEESHILIAFVTYFVGIASPGPTTIAIMNIAMSKGRKSALIFSSGVLLGSLIWAVLALFGVAVLLSTHPNSLYVLKVLGGSYLLWLSYQSVQNISSKKEQINSDTLPSKKIFYQGLVLHVTNPKAIFTWVAIVSLALPQSASINLSLLVVIGCLLLGVGVFGGYAVMFSTLKAQRIYRKLGNWFDGILAVAFGVAGFKLLSSLKA